MGKGPIGWLVAVWRFVVDVALRWYHGRVGDLAASITFWLVISLPASVLALLALLGPLDRMITGAGLEDTIQSEVERFISRVFTGEADAVSETVTGLFEQPNSSLAIVSVGFVLWSVSRGFAGLIRALEDIYDIEDRRPWYWTRVVAVILGIGSMLISIPLVLLEVFVWSEIGDGLLESILRGLVAIAVLVLWASVVYHYGPAERHRWRFDLPGAVVAAIGWWLLTFGFARYVDLTSNSNEVRAAVGASLLVLTWIWVAAQVLLVGGAVNFLLGERLGVTRGRRTWTINEVVTKGTGEIRKIVVPDRDDPSGQPDVIGLEDPDPTPVAFGRPVNGRGNGNGGRSGNGSPAERPAATGDQARRSDPSF
ncbi:MAG: YihY/virulence factor BrkB family protein [Actinomycetota bacterium]